MPSRRTSRTGAVRVVTRPGQLTQFSPTDFGGIGGTGITTGIPGIDPIIEEAGRRILDRFLPGGPSGPTTGGAGTGAFAGGCPDGFEVNPATGICERSGMIGEIQRFLPGGQTGVLNGGAPVTGAFGLPAQTPSQVGTIRRSDGTVGPILRCPRGMVLGADDLCYVKGTRGVVRKWKPAPKPPISAGDAKAIRRADAARNRVKRLATKSGFTCRKR